jgi:hypothetical protein
MKTNLVRLTNGQASDIQYVLDWFRESGGVKFPKLRDAWRTKVHTCTIHGADGETFDIAPPEPAPEPQVIDVLVRYDEEDDPVFYPQTNAGRNAFRRYCSSDDGGYHFRTNSGRALIDNLIRDGLTFGPRA